MKYNIEKIELKREDRCVYMYIEGWCVSDTKKDIEAYIDERRVLFDCEYIYRSDVNEYLNIEDKSSNGFRVKLKATKGRFKLVLKDEEQQEEYIISDLKERIKEYRGQYGIARYINRRNYNRLKMYLRTIGLKGTFNVIMNKLRKASIEENIPNIKPYQYNYDFKETKIPEEWIKIQRNQVSFAIIIKIQEWKDEYNIGLESLQKQIYKNFMVYFLVKDKKVEGIIKSKVAGTVIKYVFVDSDDKWHTSISEEYITEYCLYDELCSTTFAHILEAINIGMQPEIIYSDYDYFEKDGIYHTRIKKEAIPVERLNEIIITRGIWCIKNSSEIKGNLNVYIRNLLCQIKQTEIYYINKVLLHRRMIKAELKSSIKAIAFYLPQFHAIPENDKCWGKGFTEWTNVRRGIPMFEGHNQPRKPGMLGYYNLVEDKDIQYKQAELAKLHNVYGFCYYHYWFNGKRLLEKPVENILKNKEINQPFCICWANENWTKRWDGMQHEIIMEQVHETDSDERFIKDIIDIIKDERYIRIDNRPLVLIYKIQLLQDGKQTIKKWREEVKNYGIDNLYVAIVKHPGIISPEQYGADAMVEFPPHDMNVNNITHTVKGLNKDFNGGIYDYSELANRDLTIYNYKIFRTCMLQWDNTARRMQSASIFENFCPEDYKRWLLRIKEYEILFNSNEEQVIFINAWNEWAEGTYLEPDEKYGDEFLKITKQVLESR